MRIVINHSRPDFEFGLGLILGIFMGVVVLARPHVPHIMPDGVVIIWATSNVIGSLVSLSGIIFHRLLLRCSGAVLLGVELITYGGALGVRAGFYNGLVGTGCFVGLGLTYLWRARTLAQEYDVHRRAKEARHG